jgi:nitroimidazol reductase NimA-like FMN-containing flavoprotein (pyridoxamine 5'-phosphate oxidase superfamily)
LRLVARAIYQIGGDADMSDNPPSERTRVRRKPERGAYDRTIIDGILDEALVAHLGFVADGQPYVIPTTYGRRGDWLYVHGSAASRTLRALAGGVPACVTVTLIDGVILARSAFRHSMNYRSVVVLGVAEEIVDREEKLSALETIVEHVVPGRWREVRSPSDQELRATTVLRISLAEASAKLRTGGPLDYAEDLERQCWAGEIPLRLSASTPRPHEPTIATPAYVANYRRG